MSDPLSGYAGQKRRRRRIVSREDVAVAVDGSGSADPSTSLFFRLVSISIFIRYFVIIAPSSVWMRIAKIVSQWLYVQDYLLTTCLSKSESE